MNGRGGDGGGDDGGTRANGHDALAPFAVNDVAIDSASAEQVEAAIEAIALEQPGQQPWVQMAADSLTAGEGTWVISQSSLQDFLWYELPRRWPEDAWHPVAYGAALLLEKLGLARYGAIVRSPTTLDVLAAWGIDHGEGFKRYRAATEASGIEPPDTDLLRWGSVFGVEESTARDHVSRVLEAAIVSGELRPGTSGWRKKAAALTDRSLEELVPVVGARDGPPQRWLDSVLSERVASWVTGARIEPLREWRRRATARFMDGRLPVVPADPSEEVLESTTASLTWLLQGCRGGAKSTASGYLPVALVREGAERFGWWRSRGQPRTESDVFPLLMLHDLATRMRWLTKRAGRIRTTRSGIALVADRASLWRAIAGTVGQQDAFSAAISELIAHRLLDGPARADPLGHGDELGEAIAPVIEAQGWRRGGVPLDPRQASYSTHGPLREWRLFGFLDEERPRWVDGQAIGDYRTSLSDAGQAAAVAHLHALATAPRMDVYG